MEDTFRDKQWTIVKANQLDTNDVGKGAVRLDSQLMGDLNWNPGDAIEIQGSRSELHTAAIVWPAKKKDKGTKIIRLDPDQRENAQIRIDDPVKIRRIEQVPTAESIIIRPFGSNITIEDPNLLAKFWLDRIIVKKSKITLYLMNQTIAFRIENYQPSVPFVKIDAQTNFTIKEAISGEEKKITYSDLGGLDDVIIKIREMVELPLRYPQIFEQLGVTPPKGILLYGPPGTGKTLLAKAVANETNAFFIPVNGPQLISKYSGGTEENFRNVFQEARDNAPSIIFFDEIDSIAGKRTETYNSSEKNIISTLLTEMDGMSGKESIVFIGATNLPDAIDPAIRRPGRFDREIEIGVPDKKARLAILKIHTRGMPLDPGVDLELIAEKTPGFVGADLALLAKEAGLQAVRRIFPSF